MSKAIAVNLKREQCDVYVGRKRTGMHFGNPFSHIGYGQIKVGSRQEAVDAYLDWLSGTAWLDVEPTRRKWILENIATLRGKRLGCYCKPLACHADLLAEAANRLEIN